MAMSISSSTPIARRRFCDSTTFRPFSQSRNYAIGSTALTMPRLNGCARSPAGRSRHRRLDWEQALGRFMGRIAYWVPAGRVIADLVAPIGAIEDEETRMEVLNSFLDAYATQLFDANRPIDADSAAVWRAAASIAFDGMTPHREYRRSRALDAAGFCSYGRPVFDPNWQHAASLRRSSPNGLTLVRSSRWRRRWCLLWPLRRQPHSALTPRSAGWSKSWRRV